MSGQFAPKRPTLLILALCLALLLASCATSRRNGRGVFGGRHGSEFVKDNRPSIWISDNSRVAGFRAYYARTNTVEKALRKGRRYLPTILREFRKRRLPIELAYLPMLESMFENRADSGHARGMWQFTRQTAEHMGLKVGMFADERLNWKKATRAAAEYLERLGKKFNYNWALALAAYNGGPNYVESAMRSQHSWNYFDLRLRKEVAEYVPRFIAMVQVAKEKFPHMLMASRYRYRQPRAG